MAVDVVVPELWIQARQNGLPERRRVAGFVDSHPEVDALGMRAVEADLAMVIHRQVGGFVELIAKGAQHGLDPWVQRLQRRTTGSRRRWSDDVTVLRLAQVAFVYQSTQQVVGSRQGQTGQPRKLLRRDGVSAGSYGFQKTKRSLHRTDESGWSHVDPPQATASSPISHVLYIIA